MENHLMDLKIQKALPLPQLTSVSIENLQLVVASILVVALGILVGSVSGGAFAWYTLFNERICVVFGAISALVISLFVCTKLQITSRYIQYFQECTTWLQEKMSHKALNHLKQIWRSGGFSSKEQVTETYANLFSINQAIMKQDDGIVCDVWREFLGHLREYRVSCLDYKVSIHTSFLLDQLSGDRFHLYPHSLPFDQLQERCSSSLETLCQLSNIEIGLCRGKESVSLEVGSENTVVVCMVGGITELSDPSHHRGNKEKIWLLEYLLEDPVVAVLPQSFSRFWDVLPEISQICVDIPTDNKEKQENYRQKGFVAKPENVDAANQRWFLQRPS